VDAIQMVDGRAVIDADRCRGCGRCVEVCPLDAIDLTFAPATSVQQAIDRIAPLVELD
jgi:Fe-S-cluster-containing hydrogenase component 2